MAGKLAGVRNFLAGMPPATANAMKPANWGAITGLMRQDVITKEIGVAWRSSAPGYSPSARLDDEPFSISLMEGAVQWLLHRRTASVPANVQVATWRSI